MSDNSLDSSDRKPQKTVDESSLNTPQAQKTVVEPNETQPPRAAFVRKDSLEGKTIGDNNRYLLQTLLGQGGMSKVYRALDTKFADKVIDDYLFGCQYQTFSQQIHGRNPSYFLSQASQHYPNF